MKASNPKASKCLKKFLRFFKKGFYDATYLAWERDYKWNAHEAWNEHLNKQAWKKLLEEGKFSEVAAHATRIESRTNLLFSFEKMALRDAVKPSRGAELFSITLFEYVHGTGSMQRRFEQFADALSRLPRRQTRVLTWPLQTVFGFIADPQHHIFLKPRVTQMAAEAYGYEFEYKSKPNWHTYQSLIGFAEQIRHDHPQLKPRDYMDLQSFIWVMGSDEY